MSSSAQSAPTGLHRRLRRRIAATLLVLAGAWPVSGVGQWADPRAIRVVGGLPGVAQYTQLEQPFWTSEITRISGGRIVATIQPSDAGTMRQADMLKLLRLGTVPFGTALLAVVAGDEPDLNLLDIPGLHGDASSLRSSTARQREAITEILRERHRIKLLGIYVYPAQVLYCAKPFTGLADLAGRRVRTSSVGQSEFIGGAGAIPIMLPFGEIVTAMQAGTIDCAVTGTLSGNEIGLADVATHIHEMTISWGTSVFGANVDAWNALAPDIRVTIEQSVGDLERRIWERAASDTAEGLACNTGAVSCPAEKRKHMILVRNSTLDDRLRRRIFSQVTVPRWFARCGTACSERSRDFVHRTMQED